MNHEAPIEKIFTEMKEVAKKIWRTRDNTYGYVTEKIERVDSVRNHSDNAMVFYEMFDRQNQALMRSELSSEALEYIKNNN